MAGIFRRITRALGSNGEPEQPADPIRDAYGEQIELLQQVRRGAAEVAANRKRLAQHMTQLAAEVDSLTVSARRLLEQGRDDLAREALLRKQSLSAQLTALEAEHDQLRLTEERLVLTSTRLQAKIDAIRTKRDTVWASYSAAEAQARVAAAFAALDGDLGRAGQVVQQAAQQSDAVAAPQQVASELRQGDFDEQAASELAAMKAEIASRAPIEAEHGSYRQPGEPAEPDVQDTWPADARRAQ